jgi:hypothetical protein
MNAKTFGHKANNPQKAHPCPLEIKSIVLKARSTILGTLGIY